jgi:hypothetical protein
MTATLTMVKNANKAPKSYTMNLRENAAILRIATAEKARKSAVKTEAAPKNAATGTVAILAEALKSESIQVRAHAARQLGRLGVRAEAAVPALRLAVANESVESVRCEIFAALRAIQKQEKKGEKGFLKALLRSLSMPSA